MVFFKIKKLLITIIPLFFIIGLLLNIPIKNTQAITQDLDYTFDNDYIFNSDNLNYTTFNLRNQSQYTGHYNATYSFTNEIDDTSGIAMDFINIDLSGINCSGSIYNSWSGHNKILRIYDKNSTGAVDLRNGFKNQVYGSIEFWILSLDETEQLAVYILQEGTARIAISLHDFDFHLFYDSIWNDITPFSQDLWYHIRIDFNCISDTNSLFINNVNYGIFNFMSEASFVNGIRILTSPVNEIGNTGFFDAIGYSWGDFDYGGNQTYLNYLDNIDYIYGSYRAGVIYDTYYNDSNHFDIDSELSEGYYYTEIDLYFNYNLLEHLYLKCTILGPTPDSFDIVDQDLNILYTSFSNNEIDIILSDINCSNIKIYILSIFDYYTKFYFIRSGFNYTSYYQINDNIIPYLEVNPNIQEVDKCEFDFNITTLQPNDLASLTIDNNWIENDDSNDWVVQTNGYGKGISIDYGNTQLQDYYGIYKNFGYNNKGIFNISFDIILMSLNAPNLDGWYFDIYSYDDTLLVSLLFNLTAPPYTYLYYYNGSNYIEIHEIVSGLDFSFNIYIDSWIILRLNDNDVIYNWNFPKLTDKIGINAIEIIGGHKDDIGDFSSIELDSIGLYINGSSYLPDDLSSMIIETDIENWDDSIYNLFHITGNGSFSFSVYYSSALADIILPHSTFNSETKIVNYVDGNIFEGSSPYTFVGISNTSFTISEVYVYAIILTEGVNIYLPTIEYNNVDNTENFFYVINHRLYFNVDLNNYSYEGIRATFNIPEISTINGTISFQNYYSGHLTPYFCLNYTYSDINYYQFKNYPNTIRYILPQNQYLYQFIINVSDYIPFLDDNYTNHNSGFMSGYIQNIKLGYIPDIGITITTIDLITVIIPIMFIFIPSLMFYYGFGKEAVIPAIILMSIIALISNLIQAWIFFIIAYSVFIQLITQRKRLI